TVGLRRAGFTSEQRLELRRLYHALFRSGQRLSTALAAARKEFTSAIATMLLDFMASAKRGVCTDPRAKAVSQKEEELIARRAQLPRQFCRSCHLLRQIS